MEMEREMSRNENWLTFRSSWRKGSALVSWWRGGGLLRLGLKKNCSKTIMTGDATQPLHCVRGTLAAIALLCLVLLCTLCGVRGEQQEGTAYWDQARQTINVVPGVHDDGLAWAAFDDLVNATGWARLTIVVRSDLSPPF
jgi:hypothetical protein